MLPIGRRVQPHDVVVCGRGEPEPFTPWLAEVVPQCLDPLDDVPEALRPILADVKCAVWIGGVAYP